VAQAAADAAAAAAAMGAIDTLGSQEGHPWRQGDYQAAVRGMGLSAACATAMQPHVWGLDEMPALLRVPLGAVLPLPSFTVHALAHHGQARAAALAAHMSGLAGHDSLTAMADPFAGTWLVGWVDGDALIVPSHSGIAFATLTLLATLMLVYALTLYAAEVLHEHGPKALRWCRARAPVGLGRAAVPRAASAHGHAE
jgi:hypothetical protein